jgi:hypothetical protein
VFTWYYDQAAIDAEAAADTALITVICLALLWSTASFLRRRH